MKKELLFVSAAFLGIIGLVTALSMWSQAQDPELLTAAPQPPFQHNNTTTNPPGTAVKGPFTVTNPAAPSSLTAYGGLMVTNPAVGGAGLTSYGMVLVTNPANTNTITMNATATAPVLTVGDYSIYQTNGSGGTIVLQAPIPLQWLNPQGSTLMSLDNNGNLTCKSIQWIFGPRTNSVSLTTATILNTTYNGLSWSWYNNRDANVPMLLSTNGILTLLNSAIAPNGFYLMDSNSVRWHIKVNTSGVLSTVAE